MLQELRCAQAFKPLITAARHSQRAFEDLGRKVDTAHFAVECNCCHSFHYRSCLLLCFLTLHSSTLHFLVGFDGVVHG